MAFNSGSATSDERHMFVPSASAKVSMEVRRHVSPATHAPSWVGTFTVNDEDHTVGQLLRNSLNANPRVLSAGYAIPHPLEALLKLHVQTVANCAPRAALDAAIDRCLLQLDVLTAQIPKTK